jgi:hypothetical protein
MNPLDVSDGINACIVSVTSNTNEKAPVESTSQLANTLSLDTICSKKHLISSVLPANVGSTPYTFTSLAKDKKGMLNKRNI